MADEAKEGVLRDQALRLDKSSLTVADECLRFRFEESADLVALMASHGELDYGEVLALVRGVLSGDRDAEEAATALDAYALSSLDADRGRPARRRSAHGGRLRRGR